MSALLAGLAGVVAGLAAARIWGAWRWCRASGSLVAAIAAARTPAEPAVPAAADLATLPPPVQRWFRTVLPAGPAPVAAARIEHVGTFAVGEDRPRWRPFRSVQRVVTEPPGFVWDARIAMAPGLTVHVHDAYVAGEGILQASLWGALRVAQARGTDALARGELMRFVAEAAWYPTALLPGERVRWTAVDERSADVTFTDGGACVTLRFCFDEQGLLDTVRADARERMVGGTMVPTPWQGRFWHHAARDGMRVPLQGEVAWLLPDGPRPYWRGDIIGLDYEFVR